MSKKLFKIIFFDETKEPLTVHAEKVDQSQFLGLIEASGLIFPESSDIIITPGDDKVRNLFKDTQRIFIPINMVIRIDEISKSKTTHIIDITKSEQQQPS